jgi:HD superfamily phosphohydrolase
MAKVKEFKDSVHGYISIPKEYCINFIDTPIFHRLRRIEQTSMRALFPSARHDRFIHSLGVFHLGKLAFHYPKKNTQLEWKDIIQEGKWKVYEKSFNIACLMHDCAHSPFSHTFENNYIINRKKNVEEELFQLNLQQGVVK